MTTSQELDRAQERADKAAAELRRTQAELRVTQVQCPSPIHHIYNPYIIIYIRILCIYVCIYIWVLFSLVVYARFHVSVCVCCYRLYRYFDPHYIFWKYKYLYNTWIYIETFYYYTLFLLHQIRNYLLSHTFRCLIGGTTTHTHTHSKHTHLHLQINHNNNEIN